MNSNAPAPCLCGTRCDTTPFYCRGPVDYVRSNTCGLIFRQNPDDAAYDAAYFDERKFNQWAEAQDVLIPARLAQIAAFFPTDAPVRLLEVGGGRGSFIKHVVKTSWDVTVVEPNKVAHDFLTATYKVPVRSSVVELPLAAFDVVHLNHVLEHIKDPIGTLKLLRERLRPGGIIWIEVPCELFMYRIMKVFDALSFGANSPTRIYEPTHAVLYTTRTLQHVLERAGFSGVNVTWTGWCDPARRAAFYTQLPPTSRLLAEICRFTLLDKWLDGGWLIATAKA